MKTLLVVFCEAAFLLLVFTIGALCSMYMDRK